MSVRRPRARNRNSRSQGEHRSLKEDFLRHGHGWVAAIASLIGVLVTVAVSVGAFDPPEPSPSADVLIGGGATGSSAQPIASNPDPSSTTRPPASRRPSQQPASSAGANGPVGVGGDVTSIEQLAPMLERFDLPSRAPYTEYRTVGNDEHGISVKAPVEWTDVYAGNWLDNQLDEEVVIGSMALATPSERGLYAGYATEALFFAASTQFLGLNGEQLLSELGFNTHLSCEWASGGNFANESYIGGRYDIFWDCDGLDTVVVDIGAPSRDGEHAVVLHFRLTSTADVAALTQAIDSFRFDPPAEAGSSP